MGPRLAIAAGCIVPLIVAAACEAQTFKPGELGDCTPSDPTVPCTAVVGGGGGGGEGGTDGTVGPKYLDETPCMVGGDVLYFNGPSGPVTVTQGAFDGKSMSISNWEVIVTVSPIGFDAGPYQYGVEFSSDRPNVPPLMVGDYPMAQQVPYPGHPGMTTNGYGPGCQSANFTEEFYVYDIAFATLDGGVSPQSLTVGFSETCDTTVIVYGCIRYGH
jgi:hypothetical protein